MLIDSKRLENIFIQPVRKGTFRHTLILETLVAHFTMFPQGQRLRGLEIGEPILALALSAAAVMFIMKSRLPN
jgi:hypothetical protein